MATSAKSKFKPTGENNSDFLKLVQDLTEWRDLKPYPSEWLKPQQFAKEFSRYSEFDPTSFRHAYNRAKLKVKRKYSHFISLL